MIKINLCPFCGGRARIRRTFETWSRGHIMDEFVAECTECGASSSPFKSDIWMGESGVVNIDANGAADAAAAWNRRASDG